MSHPIRMYAQDLFFEVTIRTIEGTFWFHDDDPAQTAAINGAFAAAQLRHPVKIYAYHMLSNHYHGLYWAPDPETMAKFLNHLHAALARIANRRHNRRGPVWNSSAHVIPVVIDETTLMKRIDYIMGQAVKAGLASHPSEFRGASSLPWMLRGDSIDGTKFDQTARTLDARRKSGPKVDEAYGKRVSVTMSRLPCHEGLADDVFHKLYQDIAKDISERRTKAIEGEDTPQPIDKSSQTDPPDQPQRSAPPPLPRRKPIVHAPTARDRDEYIKRFQAFEDEYDLARQELRAQEQRGRNGRRARAVVFPFLAFPCRAGVRGNGGSAAPAVLAVRAKVASTMGKNIF